MDADLYCSERRSPVLAAHSADFGPLILLPGTVYCVQVKCNDGKVREEMMEVEKSACG